MSVPPLPVFPLTSRLMRGPTESSNWLVKDIVLCGEYPGNKDLKRHMSTLTKYSNAGIPIFHLPSFPFSLSNLVLCGAYPGNKV